jgi:hypothetical protein
MLQKNVKYYNKKDDKTYELIDYVFYNGTNEHGFTFLVDYQTIKKIIKHSELDEFLLQFIIKNHTENSSEQKEIDSKYFKKNDMQDKHISEAKDILLDTIKDLRSNKIKVDVADSIAKTSQTLVNCVRTELLIKNSNNKI